MRNLLRSPAVPLLLILAIPVIAIGYSIAAASQSSASSLFQTASDWFLAIGLVLIVIAAGMTWVLRRKAPDERNLLRQATTLLVGAELVLDSYSFQLAVVSQAAGLILIAIPAAWIVVWSIPRLRQIRFVSSVVVQRRPQAVFEFVSDFRNHPRWRVEVESAEKITDGPIGAGTRFRESARMRNGTQIFGIEQIIDFEPGRRLTSRTESSLAPNLDVVTFEPADDGTRVTFRFDLEQSLSVAALGARLWQRRQNRQIIALRKAWEVQLKQILESDEVARPTP